MVKTKKEVKELAEERKWYCLVNEEKKDITTLIYLTEHSYLLHFRFVAGELRRINNVSC